ncbi:MAG TPA: DedA family protein [Tepidisphaeraceae bacterium]|jgi:membrane protein DedA with SNARE-associated domain|nr:DedA family protein [Tepidisphaeraceae bacterium]
MPFFLAFTLNRIEDWLVAGGYFVLFGLLFACGLGLPLPEDIPLLAAGALIATGKMHFVPAAICAWLGIIGGDIVLYHLGKHYGLQITRVPFVGKHITTQRIQRAEQLFSKYGVWVIAVGRLFAGVRGGMVIAAGAIRYNLITFIIADGLAALVSGGLWLWLGHWLGARLQDHMTDIERWKRHIFVGIILLAIIAAVVIYLIKRRKHIAPSSS